MRPSLLHRYLGHAEAHQMMRRGAEKISYTASRFLCASRRHLAEEKVTHTGQVKIFQHSLKDIYNLLMYHVLEVGR